MNNNVLTFYSIGVRQVNTLYTKIGKPDEDGIIKGKIPLLGELEARVNYAESSGQLQVEVLEKPMLLSIHTIQAHIQDALNNAAIEENGIGTVDGPVEPPPTKDGKPTDAKKNAKPATEPPVKSAKPVPSESPASPK